MNLMCGYCVVHVHVWMHPVFSALCDVWVRSTLSLLVRAWESHSILNSCCDLRVYREVILSLFSFFCRSNHRLDQETLQSFLACLIADRPPLPLLQPDTPERKPSAFIKDSLVNRIAFTNQTSPRLPLDQPCPRFQWSVCLLCDTAVVVLSCTVRSPTSVT